MEGGFGCLGFFRELQALLLEEVKLIPRVNAPCKTSTNLTLFPPANIYFTSLNHLYSMLSPFFKPLQNPLVTLLSLFYISLVF